MEVAGLTASIITLIGAATLAGATVSRIWGLRDAPPLYVLTALNEINDFKATLKLAQYALESLPGTPIDLIDEEIARFLNRAKTSLAAFNTYLHEKVIRESANGSDVIILRRRAKLKEILGEAQSEMSVLQQELASIKLSLNTALTAMHIRNHGQLAMSIQQVQIIHSGSSTTLNAGDMTDLEMTMHTYGIRGFDALEEFIGEPTLFEERILDIEIVTGDFGAELDLPVSNGWSLAEYAIYMNKPDLNGLAKRGYSLVIYFAASTGDVRTMQILTKAKIEGLPMTIEYRELYWDAFGSRDESFVGVRQSPEVERAAFQALLDSIVPMDPKDIPGKVFRFPYEETVVPGSFPVDENEDEEEDEGSEFSLDDRVAFSGDDDDSSSYGYEDTQRANDAGNRPGHREVTGVTDDCDADVNGEEKSTSSDTSQDHTSSQMTVVS
ncbi:hypothetical protein N0V95_006822 [Ascochyta clinopodiicola]|nr:hypothetical protein N0V95_006822 [Ascochyta clinopodiicola]